MHFSISAIATLALATAAAVNGQVVGDNQAPAPGQGAGAPSCGSAAADAVFQNCLGTARTLRATNCAQFERTQGYDFFNCACENAKVTVQCYDQCASQPGLKLIAQSEQTSLCDAAARLKPVTTTSTTSKAAGATPAVDVVTVTAGPTATGAPAKGSNGAAGVSAKVGSAAAVGGVVAFVAAALA